MGLAQSVDLRLSDDSLPRLVLEIEVGECLAIVVAHNKQAFCSSVIARLGQRHLISPALQE